jgi:hypothetical protein
MLTLHPKGPLTVEQLQQFLVAAELPFNTIVEGYDGEGGSWITFNAPAENDDHPDCEIALVHTSCHEGCR